MQKVEIEAPCRGCPDSDFCVNENKIYADGHVIINSVTLSCSHERVCAKYISERKMKI